MTPKWAKFWSLNTNLPHLSRIISIQRWRKNKVEHWWKHSNHLEQGFKCPKISMCLTNIILDEASDRCYSIWYQFQVANIYEIIDMIYQYFQLWYHKSSATNISNLDIADTDYNILNLIQRSRYSRGRWIWFEVGLFMDDGDGYEVTRNSSKL